MKKNYFLQFVLIIGFRLCGYSQVIFSEDFEGTAGAFPAGWTLFNVDGLTPNSSVNYVNNAWIVREDFEGLTPPNNAAFSTSWYSPAGTSDDWMMTPAVTLTANNKLIWDALAPDASFSDGYEVRISSTTPTIAASSTVLFSTAAENSTFTNRIIDLSAYAGQTVYISWRNNSTDKFLLLIDNVSIDTSKQYDAELVATSTSQYTQIPLTQVQNLNSNITVNNIGFDILTNVAVTLNVFDALMNNVYTESSVAIASLASGASQSVSLTGFTPSNAGTYTFDITVSSNEVDGDTSNNLVSHAKEIQSTYARDNNVITGSLGNGSGTGAQLGQEFEVVNTNDVVSVSFMISNGDGSLTGQTTYVKIWDMLAGVPNAIIAQTDLVTITSTVNELYTAPITGGNFSLNPGQYVFTVEEGVDNIQLATTTEIFTPLKTWINFPGIPSGTWSHNEDFDFNVSYVIRPNFDTSVLSNPLNTLNDNDIVIYPNPVENNLTIKNNSEEKLKNASVYDISGRILVNYDLNENQLINIDISNLSSGNYLIIIKSETGQISKKLFKN